MKCIVNKIARSKLRKVARESTYIYYSDHSIIRNFVFDYQQTNYTCFMIASLSMY